MKGTVALLTLFLCVPSLCHAEPRPAPKVPVASAETKPDLPAAAEPPETPDGAGLLARLGGMMAFVLLLCAGILWLARSASRFSGPRTDPTGRLRHEAAVPLDRRCTLHLLRVGDQSVVVAADPAGIKATVVLDEPFDDLLEAARGR